MRAALLLLAVLPMACSNVTHRGKEIQRTEVLPVSEAQRFLLVTGYDTGRVDGILGPETQGALDAYAADSGLPSGTIDTELSYKLKRDALMGDGSAQLGSALAALTADVGFTSVSSAQRSLIKAGYKPGPVDGILGPRTAAALRAFQRDNGLPVTGKLDSSTSEALKSG